MPPLPLNSGAYSSRSIIANAQRCVNLVPEGNPDNTTPPSPTTHYPAPGLTWLGQFVQGGEVRKLYTSQTGDLFAVCGNGIYYLPPSFNPQLLAVLATSSGIVGMSDNGSDLLVTDETTLGYTVNLKTKVTTGIDSANNSGTNGFAYYGGSTLDFVDGFVIGNIPGTPSWWATAFEDMKFDPLSFATKSGNRDNIKGVIVLQRNVWLIGEKATELWGNVGGTNFPFALIQGPYVQHGTPSATSIVREGEGAFFIGQNTNGQAFALQASGYKVDKISTFAIENEWNSYGDLSNTRGFSFFLNGHMYIGWRFPTVSKTWIYDVSTKQWHERVTTDSNGDEGQWRVNTCAFAYGKLIAGDYENGYIYEIDPDNRTDAGVPHLYRRGFPHINVGMNRTRHNMFKLDVQCGEPLDVVSANTFLFYDGVTPGPLVTEGGDFLILDPVLPDSDLPENLIWLRWSDDRGKTWKNPVSKSMGETGEYNRNIMWTSLGQARDRVYEVYWGRPMVTALNQAFISIVPGKS